jgi:hypothetical protein
MFVPEKKPVCLLSDLFFCFVSSKFLPFWLQQESVGSLCYMCWRLRKEMGRRTG